MSHFPQQLRRKEQHGLRMVQPYSLLRVQQHLAGGLGVSLADLHNAGGHRLAGQDRHWNPQPRGLIPQSGAYRRHKARETQQKACSLPRLPSRRGTAARRLPEELTSRETQTPSRPSVTEQLSERLQPTAAHRCVCLAGHRQGLGSCVLPGNFIALAGAQVVGAVSRYAKIRVQSRARAHTRVNQLMHK